MGAEQKANAVHQIEEVLDDAQLRAEMRDILGNARLTRPRRRTDSIKVIDGTYTAQAFITTDKDDNQITAFHPGAMNSEAHSNE
jgi:adenosine kinase